MARCSQERLCWHGPDCTRRDSSCPRQRRLETIHSQAAVACPKALSQVSQVNTDSHHKEHQLSHHCSCIEETEITEGNSFGIYKYLGTAIWIHDIMLGTKEELGRNTFGKNVCLFAAGGKALLFHFARIT